MHALFLPITRCRLVWMLTKLQVVDPWLAASSQNGTTPLCGLRWGPSTEGGRGALTTSACNRTALGDSGEMLHLPASSQTSAQPSPAPCAPPRSQPSFLPGEGCTQRETWDLLALQLGGSLELSGLGPAPSWAVRPRDSEGGREQGQEPEEPD